MDPNLHLGLSTISIQLWSLHLFSWICYFKRISMPLLSLLAASPAVFFHPFLQWNIRIFLYFSVIKKIHSSSLKKCDSSKELSSPITTDHTTHAQRPFRTHERRDLTQWCISSLPIVTFKRRFYIYSWKLECTIALSLNFFVILARFFRFFFF